MMIISLMELLLIYTRQTPQFLALLRLEKAGLQFMETPTAWIVVTWLPVVTGF